MTDGRRALRWVSTLILAGAALFGITVMAAGFFIFLAADSLPRVPQPLSRIIQTPKTQIFAANGEKLITLGRLDPVPLERVSPHFIHAILAVEDHRFYTHPGLSKLRTFKALYITLFKPGEIQGASTITQQLAKNLFFSFEKTYLRKFRELLVALQIEASFSKPQILHAYVNQIAFGAGAQGVERAARVYFNKSAADITLAEAALLAGLPKSPTRYNPYRHYERAVARQGVVIRRMVAAGYLTPSQADAALAHPPRPAFNHADARTGSFFLDTLITRLIRQYGKSVVYHGGIRVTTTLDPRMQNAAQSALVQGLTSLDAGVMPTPDSEQLQGALVAIEPDSGAVRAMIGGRNYHRSEFNRAVSARRQPGSGFKPFVYYTALSDLGYHGGTLVRDAPVRIPLSGGTYWEPKNADGIYRGTLPLKRALTQSINTIAARLVNQTGPESVIQTARQCGISSPLDPVPAIALGTSPVSPFEMASAYGVFAAGGIRHEPFMVWRIEDARGQVLFEHRIQGRTVLDPATTYQVVDMMKSVVDQGTARQIRRSGFQRPAAGKTGTTDLSRDAWFTGFTPGLSACVWIGFDSRVPMKTRQGSGISGSSGAVPVWTRFMKDALKNEPVREFSIPGTLTFKSVSSRTGCPPALLDAPDLSSIPLKDGQSLCDQEETP